MFEKFGEFGSAEELNAAAEGLREEGDWDSLQILAKENGIDVEDAQDYMTGDMPVFASEYNAAAGRLEVQRNASKLPGPMKTVIYGMAETMLEDNGFCKSIMQKGKNLDRIIDLMREEASKNRTGNMGCVCGTDRDLKRRILDFYGGRA